MKISLFIFTLLILSGCVSHAISVSEVSKTAQPTPTVENANSNANNQFSYTDYQYDSALLDKLNAENERFRAVPDEFKSVDFENFKFSFGRLKNGEYEDFDPNNVLAGKQSYSLTDVFYIDLIDDSKKEAIVFLYEVSCGASCNGGADLVYFYSSNKGKAKLIDILEMGANSGGCSLKSFKVKEKKLYIEQFGKCVKNTLYDEDNPYVCKFCANGETHSIYSINNNGLKRESVNVFETKAVDVMISPAFISIND